jgi:ribosomal protein S18 acetylase RimI-like enzyme
MYKTNVMSEQASIIKISPANYREEHICCAFSDKKCQRGYQLKKEWLVAQYDKGYTFKKLDVRAKVFIEYCPAEKGWLPVEANGYMLINCFWVSGKYKGKGFGKALLQECIRDAQGMAGLIAVVAKKKQAFMSDKKFFIKQGFERCDSAPPYFELLYLPFDNNVPKPRFKDVARNARCDQKEGLSVYYTAACPFNDYYVNVELKRIASERNIPLSINVLDDTEKAQNHFVPHTLYSIFYKGDFVTQQVLSEKQFDRLLNI